MKIRQAIIAIWRDVYPFMMSVMIAAVCLFFLAYFAHTAHMMTENETTLTPTLTWAIGFVELLCMVLYGRLFINMIDWIKQKIAGKSKQRLWHVMSLVYLFLIQLREPLPETYGWVVNTCIVALFFIDEIPFFHETKAILAKAWKDLVK